MATITLEYNVRNQTATKIIDIILAMNNVFRVKTLDKAANNSFTRSAIQDAENGNVIICDSYDDYLKQTAKYA